MTSADRLLAAASFAARAHRQQMRKDNETPYSAHPMRVCLIAARVFGVDDPAVLAAALLHDTIEDTTTDFDDLTERFGPEVAAWVAALSKDGRLADDAREAAYKVTLAASPWQVQVCKLADIYDNLTDSRHLSQAHRVKVLARSGEYLAALKANLKPEAERAFALTAERREQVAKG